MKIKALMITGLISLTHIAAATPKATQILLKQYGSGLNFNANRGRSMWTQKGIVKNNHPRTCATCHGEDLTKLGKHKKTGKIIQPMAVSVNQKRLNKVKKIKKWFKRNCKWTWGRECTAQEKGDFLMYFLNQ